MSSTYIHTKRRAKYGSLVLRVLAAIYLLLVLACIGYVWFLAKDRYQSSGSFKITREGGSGVEAGLLQLALPVMSDSGSSDSQVCIGYIQSSDLLFELEEKFDLANHFSSIAGDPIFKLKADANVEERLEYYRKRITAHYDKDTGLTNVSVETFDPVLSQKVAQALIEKSEKFVNRINQEVADQQLGFLSKEVERMNERVAELNTELMELQNEHRFVNPEEVLETSMEMVKEMQLEKIRSEVELNSLLRDSSKSPMIESIRSKLRSLDELIEVETAKLSGSERNRLNKLLLEFNELRLKIDFATRLRTGAETMLEKNRVEAMSLSRFFSVVQTPYLPEDVSHPKRLYTTGAILVFAILLFIILKVLASSVLERA